MVLPLRDKGAVAQLCPAPFSSLRASPAQGDELGTISGVVVQDQISVGRSGLSGLELNGDRATQSRCQCGSAGVGGDQEWAGDADTADTQSSVAKVLQGYGLCCACGAHFLTGERQLRRRNIDSGLGSVPCDRQRLRAIRGVVGEGQGSRLVFDS